MENDSQWLFQGARNKWRKSKGEARGGYRLNVGKKDRGEGGFQGRIKEK